MNIIKDLELRISKRLEETKNPCKSYKTYEAAEKAVQKVCEMVKEHHALDSSPMYVVFLHQQMNRYVAAICLNEVLGRKECRGGYLGIAADEGFYTF